MRLNADTTHPDYDKYESRWEFYVRSYMGGEDYFNGAYLTRYISETSDDYDRRLDLTPLDNHCKNIVHIYSSFLWRVPPTRAYNSAANNVALEPFLNDADLDGRSFNAFMREAQIWSSVYGHVWLMMDKPKSNAGTKAEELAQDIRPYVTMFTPENVLDWNYVRTASGRFELDYLKVRESVIRVDETTTETYYRVWYKDRVEQWHSLNDLDKMIEVNDNVLGRIPAVFLPAQRSITRGIGISDIADASYMQRAIYQELSEIEQLIRISNHPTLVKSFGTDASAGAGAIINMPDDMDAQLKPYQMQPSGQNLDAVRASIDDKVQSINRMSHMGAVRGTTAITQSGVAMQVNIGKHSEQLKKHWSEIRKLWGVTNDKNKAKIGKNTKDISFLASKRSELEVAIKNLRAQIGKDRAAAESVGENFFGLSADMDKLSQSLDDYFLAVQNLKQLLKQQDKKILANTEAAAMLRYFASPLITVSCGTELYALKRFPSTAIKLTFFN